jgi:hypothetical protein
MQTLHLCTASPQYACLRVSPGVQSSNAHLHRPRRHCMELWRHLHPPVLVSHGAEQLYRLSMSERQAVGRCGPGSLIKRLVPAFSNVHPRQARRWEPAQESVAQRQSVASRSAVAGPCLTTALQLQQW